MTDYESDSIDGRDQPDMIEVSRAEWERVQEQLKMARAALEAVEWRAPYTPDTMDDTQICPWCGGIKKHGHASNCQRQAALAALDAPTPPPPTGTVG